MVRAYERHHARRRVVARSSIQNPSLMKCLQHRPKVDLRSHLLPGLAKGHRTTPPSLVGPPVPFSVMKLVLGLVPCLGLAVRRRVRARRRVPRHTHGVAIQLIKSTAGVTI